MPVCYEGREVTLGKLALWGGSEEGAQVLAGLLGWLTHAALTFMSPVGWMTTVSCVLPGLSCQMRPDRPAAAASALYRLPFGAD